MPSTAFSQGQPAEAPAKMIEEGLRRQTERDRQQQEVLKPQADALSASRPHTGIPVLPTEAPCFVITDVDLQGADALRFNWLRILSEPFAGHCIGVQGLSVINAYLNAELIEQGWVTSRVSMGAQNLSQGRLVLRLSTGRIDRVRMVAAGATEPLDRPTPKSVPDERWGTWANAFPTTDGRILNARDLEQGVEQMKRLPSQSVTTQLIPGTHPDTTEVLIERQTADVLGRLRGDISLDNSGSASLGRTQLSANVAFDNPLGLNDLVSASLSTNAESPGASHRSQSASVNYSLPLGYSTLTTTFSHSRFAQSIQLTTTAILSSGTSDTASLKWEHVAWRTASTRTGIYADLSTRRSRSYLDDVELLVQRRQTTFFETGLSFKHLFAESTNAELTLGYKRGVPWLSAQDDLAADPASPGVTPTLRPGIWSLNASFTAPLPVLPDMAPSSPHWTYRGTLKAQTTPDHTLSIDQMAIGNRYSVRGFDGNAVLIAENGVVLRQEVSAPVGFAAVSGAAYLGLDWGRVWGPSDTNLAGHNLAGVALGLRGKWRALQFDLALATPLLMPEGFKTARLNAYGSVSCAF